MINFPPIPPKSKRFERVGNYVLFHGYNNWGTYLHQTERVRPHIDLIASYAEVEWLKRAERWERIFVINNAEHRSRQSVGDHIGVTIYRRYRNWWLWALSDKQRKICKENADAWRRLSERVIQYDSKCECKYG